MLNLAAARGGSGFAIFQRRAAGLGSDMDCNLNGACIAGGCRCVPQWTGGKSAERIRTHTLTLPYHRYLRRARPASSAVGQRLPHEKCLQLGRASGGELAWRVRPVLGGLRQQLRPGELEEQQLRRSRDRTVAARALHPPARPGPRHLLAQPHRLLITWRRRIFNQRWRSSSSGPVPRHGPDRLRRRPAAGRGAHVPKWIHARRRPPLASAPHGDGVLGDGGDRRPRGRVVRRAALDRSL